MLSWSTFHFCKLSQHLSCFLLKSFYSLLTQIVFYMISPSLLNISSVKERKNIAQPSNIWYFFGVQSHPAGDPKPRGEIGHDLFWNLKGWSGVLSIQVGSWPLQVHYPTNRLELPYFCIPRVPKVWRPQNSSIPRTLQRKAPKTYKVMQYTRKMQSFKYSHIPLS